MKTLRRFSIGAALITGVVLWVEALEWLLPHGGLVAVLILLAWALGWLWEDLTDG